MELQFRSAPITYNDERKTLQVVIATETPVFRNGLKPFIEKLRITSDAVDLSRVNAGAPVLKDHNHNIDSVVGVIERGWIENNEVIAEIRFSERDDIQPFVNDVKTGIHRSMSIGYAVNKYEKSGEENGIPVLEATRFTIAEASFVPIPADKNAQVRSEDLEKEQEETINIIKEERKMENEDIKTQDETRSAPTVDANEVIKQERARIGEITKLVRSANLNADFAETLIGNGSSIETARSLILDEIIKKQPQITQTTTTVDAGENYRSGIESAIEIRAGYAKDDTKNEFRGMSLSEMSKRSLEIAGHSVSGSKMDIVGRAFTSTSDFPYILAATANKFLKKGYEEAVETWSTWTSTVSVPDFKAQTFVAMSEFGLLDAMAELEEYKFASLSEGKETVTVGTYGKMFGISRQAIVNDDVGAFTRIPMGLGAAAKRTLNKSVYDKLIANPTLITDSTAVFHANHTNLGTGAISGGITVATLDAARAAMRKQKDLAGSAFLNISPSVLLVPAVLEGTAKVIIGSQYDPDAANKLQRANMVFNMVESVVTDPLLDANSLTAWYLVSKQYDAFVVGFLDGNQSPYIETQNAWNVDGVQTKVRLDWGVACIDFRPIYKHTGA